MIRFLKDRMSSVSSDLYEEILKLNKVIQIVSYESFRERPPLLVLKIDISAIKGRYSFCLGRIYTRKLGLNIFFNKRIFMSLVIK